jgi:hypothetical protein
MDANMLAALKAELLNDPKGRGYSGKTPDEQARLFNSAYLVEVPVAPATQEQPARISQVLTQPFAPNAVTADDVTEALNS